MDQTHSDARTQDAPTLLRSAARLVEKALIQLDVKSAPCPHCATTLFHNREVARVYEMVTDTPDKLRRAAERLDHSTTMTADGLRKPRSTSLGFHEALLLKEQA